MPRVGSNYLPGSQWLAVPAAPGVSVPVLVIVGIDVLVATRGLAVSAYQMAHEIYPFRWSYEERLIDRGALPDIKTPAMDGELYVQPFASADQMRHLINSTMNCEPWRTDLTSKFITW